MDNKDWQRRQFSIAVSDSTHMKQVGENMLAEAIDADFLTGIDRKRRTRVPRMTLNSSDHELFRAIVTYEGTGELPQPSLESHRLLLAAYEQARAYIRKIVAPFDKKDHGDRLNAWITFESRSARSPFESS